MTINVLALLVFDEIPEIRLSEIEKLTEPIKRIKMKREIFSRGFIIIFKLALLWQSSFLK